MFVIIPYEAAEPIRFGMSADSLTKALGVPRCIDMNCLGEPDYQYPGFGVRLSANDQTVVEVGFGRQVDVRLGDVNIFSSPSAFETLIAKDGSPFEFLGFIVLLNLGITLTGFHDNDPSQKAVTAFVKGRWDDLRPKFKEYVHPSPVPGPSATNA